MRNRLLSVNNKKTPLSFIDQAALSFSRMWPIGLSPWAPGTCASAAAVIMAPWCFFPLNIHWRLALIAGLFFIGAVAASRTEKILGRNDPGQVVIDELVGQWLTLLLFPNYSILLLLLAFALFRLFDISKPWPIPWLEKKIPGGFGIMVDDLAAGVYALVALKLLALVIPL